MIPYSKTVCRSYFYSPKISAGFAFRLGGLNAEGLKIQGRLQPRCQGSHYFQRAHRENWETAERYFWESREFNQTLFHSNAEVTIIFLILSQTFLIQSLNNLSVIFLAVVKVGDWEEPRALFIYKSNSLSLIEFDVISAYKGLAI